MSAAHPANNPANSDPTYAYLLVNAQDALRQRRSAEAAGFCRQLLALPALAGADLDIAYNLYTRALDDLLQYDEALGLIARWLETTQTPNSQIDALILKGRTLRRKGQIEAAMSVLDQATGLATAARYTTAIAAANLHRSEIMLTLGDGDRALSVCRQSLRIYEEAQDITGQIDTLVLLQIIYSVMGQFPKAIQAGLKGVQLAEITENRSALYLIYNNLGEAYQNLYATNQALSFHRKAQALSESPEPDLIRNLGADLVASGEIEEGLRLLYSALVMAQDSQDQDITLQALFSLADGLLLADQVSEAAVLGQDLLDQAKLSKATRYVTRATLILGLCAQRRGEVDAAQGYLQESFIAAEQTNDRTMIWQTHAALADILAESNPARAGVHTMLVKDILGGIALSIEDVVLRHTFRHALPVARWLRPGDYEED